MPILIFNLLFCLVLVMFLAAAAFIAYHIVRYSVSSSEANTLLTIFFSGFIFLIIVDLILYLMIDKTSLTGGLFF